MVKGDEHLKKISVLPILGIQKNQYKIFQMEDGKQGLLYYDGTNYYAFDDECPHKKGDLIGGQVKNGILTCPWHRFRFDLNTGASVTNARCKLKVYKVKTNNRCVEIHDQNVEIPN